MVRFFAHFLFLLAAWTLVIKFAFPAAFSWWEGVSFTEYVMWDFWWIIHIWLGWVLLHWRRYSFSLAISVSVAEIVIILYKFIIFLEDPDWTMWTANWFVNKLFVLACFCLLLGYFMKRRRVLPSS